ncbi:MAG: serine/threonine protein kinase [Planctomycetes bacterium]|nr:serine/threonine protein kinase [Planctomycetota bacterium]
MDSQRWMRVRERVEELLELDGDARAARLAAIASLDPELAAEVARLVERDGDAPVDATPVAAPYERLFGADALAPGTRLGAYRIVAELGAGGMGAVYRAERADDEFEKAVAIKLVKRGMDSAEVLERFRKERQVLADLEHPGIARLLDGGVSPDGRPYLVMEYVEGEPIDAWCDRVRPPLDARLRLFQQICRAVHHAHQRLVVHRDLKPSNVLVDAAGEPKLLDFGVAKVLSADEHDATELTAEHAFLGTPSYASPEQLRGERVTTASDVYSLGVLLYRLLTGRRPYELSQVSREEGRRIVCEVEPTRPSRAPVAAPADAAVPRGRLTGDLDNIVMTALRKEPGRRYASAAQLAEDLERHLDGLPVLARPSTLGYRVGKFVRRNPVGVLSSAALLVTLVAGLVTSSRLYVEAAAANDAATRRFEDVRRMAATFIFDISGEIGPLEGRVEARTRIVAAALEYLDRLAAEADDDPRVLDELARAYLQLGDLQGGGTSANLGDRAAARASYAKAWELARELRARESESAGPRDLAARCLYRQSDQALLDGDGAEARRLLDDALASCPVGDAPRALELRAVVLTRLADLDKRDGRPADALPRLVECVALQERLLDAGGDDPALRRGLAVAYNKLSEARFYAGDADEAERLCRRACELLQELVDEGFRDAETPQLHATAHAWLGTMYMRQQRFEEALAPFDVAREATRRIVEADPANDLARFNRGVGLQMYATTLMRLGRHDEAVEVLREVQDGARAALARRPQDKRMRRQLAVASSVLAGTLTELRRWSDAEAQNAAALEAFEALRAAEPGAAEPRRDLAACLTNVGALHMGRAADAELSADERRRHGEAAREAFTSARAELGALADDGRLAPVDEPLLGVLDAHRHDADVLLHELAVEHPTQAD